MVALTDAALTDAALTIGLGTRNPHGIDPTGYLPPAAELAAVPYDRSYREPFDQLLVDPDDVVIGAPGLVPAPMRLDGVTVEQED